MDKNEIKGGKSESSAPIYAHYGNMIQCVCCDRV
jgi:hypothetical protein